MTDKKEIKAALRKDFKARRSAVDSELKVKWDLNICKNLILLDEYRACEAILVYYPVRGEISLLDFIRQAISDGKRVAFPRCFGKEMKFAFVAPEDLTAGAYGIPEPPEDADYVDKFSENTLCILPCLSASKDGARLGYGGGYYDRFLSDFSGIKAVAVYKSFITNADFSEEFDIRADIIITEEETIRL